MEPHVDGFHIDVMDNHFVPNLTVGLQFIWAITQVITKPLWIHLMVDNPHDWIEKLSIPKNSIISFHYEAIKSGDKIEKITEIIQAHGYIASVAINPATPLENLLPYLGVIQHALIMSVQPGYSGQPFIKSSIEKIKELQEYVTTHSLRVILAIDGGVNKYNIKQLAQAGVTDFAVGSAIFSTDNENLTQAISEIKKLVV